MSAPIEVLITSESSGQLWNACVWDINTGTSLSQYKGEKTNHRGLCLLGNQFLMGASSSKPLIHVWALQRRDQHQMRIICPGRVNALAVSPDGAYCVAAVADKIHIWQTASGNLLAVCSRHYQAVNVIRFTDNGSHFVSGGEDNLVMVWALSRVLSCIQNPSQKPEPVRIWSGHSLPVTDIYVGTGGSQARVTSSSLDQTCKIWDMVSGELLQTIVFPASLLSVAMDILEYRLFTGCSNGDIYCVNMFGQPIRSERHVDSSDQKGHLILKGHSKQVTCLSVNMDGTRLASGSHDCTVRIWDVYSGQCMRTLNHKGQVTNAFIVLMPPALTDPQLRPTLPLQQFKRTLYTGSEEKTEETGILNIRLHKTHESEEDLPVELTSCSPVDEDQQDIHMNTSKRTPTCNGTDVSEELQSARLVNRQLYLFTVNKLMENKT